MQTFQVYTEIGIMPALVNGPSLLHAWRERVRGLSSAPLSTQAVDAPQRSTERRAERTAVYADIFSNA